MKCLAIILQGSIAITAMLSASSTHAALIVEDTIIDADSPLSGETIVVEDGVDGPTTVEILDGATVAGLHAHENSRIVLDSGPITSINDLSGISFLSTLSGTSRLEMRSGLFACFDVACDTIDYSAVLEMNDSSEFHLYGGNFNGPVDALDTSTIFIHGRQLEVDVQSNPGTVPQSVLVTEEFLSGDAIIVFANVFPGATLVLAEIPEPSTGLLVLTSIPGIGLMCRRRKVL